MQKKQLSVLVLIILCFFDWIWNFILSTVSYTINEQVRDFA